MQQYQWWLDNVPKETDKFIGWLGTIMDVSRVWLRDFIKGNAVGSVLDVACGVSIDKEGFDYEKLNVRYKGIDISEFLVNRNKGRGYDCEVGNIEDIKEKDKSWDLVFGRHIVEHLEYYEKAVSEMCRVATGYVVIIHFIPMESKDEIFTRNMDGVEVYHNKYGEEKFVNFCKGFGEVTRIQMEDSPQSITLIKL